MKTVTLTRDMRPWQKGESATLPDELAAKLVQDGEAENLRPFPPPDVAPEKRVLEPRRYMTRAERRAARHGERHD